MDRTALVGIASALVALGPMGASAQTPAANAPKIGHDTGSTPQFELFAGPSNNDVARTTNVNELLVRIGLADPAVQISTGVASALAKRKGGAVVDSGRADFTVTVTTKEWSAGYYVPYRPTYDVRYSAELAVTDASGKVVKTGSCQVMPDDATTASAGDNEALIGHGGRILKTKFAKAADSCMRSLVQKIKDL